MKPKTNFNHQDWVPAIKRWSAEGIDPSTSSKGVTIYFPESGESYNASSGDGKSTLLAFKDTRNAPAPATAKVTLMLKIHGGRTAYEQCPDNGYININPEHAGPRLMSADDYEKICKAKDIPVEVIPTALDKWNTARL